MMTQSTTVKEIYLMTAHILEKIVKEVNLMTLGCIFTSRIRRMGEGTVFSLFVSSHLNRGGEDTPSQFRMEGFPIPGPEGTPSS